MSQTLLRNYYANLYPYEQLVRLLTRNGDAISDCEFAIEGKTDTGDKLYKRYVSVRGPSELRDVVSRFRGITAFHFGAFYDNGVNKERIQAGESVATRRVLSFDVDLTDMEFLDLADADGRVSAEKCDKAYPVSAAAAYILRNVLERAFGFTELLVVYSGRRGVHVHVFDDRAMAMNDEARGAVLDFVNCGMKTADARAPTGVRMIMELYGLRKEVHRVFRDYIVGKLNLLENGAGRVAFVNRLGLSEYEEYEKYAPTLAPLAADVLTLETGADVWKHVEERIHSTNVEWMRERLDCVVLAYVWPRLDAAVTSDLKHLTKVPYSCHAATGRVAVAMGTERKRLFGFKPARQAPTLAAWDQPLMDAAVARFRVAAAATSADVDMEDAAAGPAVSAAKRERKEREEAETDQRIDTILTACRSGDEARRRDTWVTMPLPSESAPPKVTEHARRVAWAKHGLAPPAHRRRFDAYGNALT